MKNGEKKKSLEEVLKNKKSWSIVNASDCIELMQIKYNMQQI